MPKLSQPDKVLDEPPSLTDRGALPNKLLELPDFLGRLRSILGRIRIEGATGSIATLRIAEQLGKQ